MILSVTLASSASAQTVAEWIDPMRGASDILAHHPRTARSWSAIVPAAYKRVRWVSRLEGTSSGARIVPNAGISYALGAVCKPHDCHDNNVAFLIAVDGRRALGGILHDRAGGRTEIFFGNPNSRERSLLHATLMEGQ